MVRFPLVQPGAHQPPGTGTNRFSFTKTISGLAHVFLHQVDKLRQERIGSIVDRLSDNFWLGKLSRSHLDYPVAHFQATPYWREYEGTLKWTITNHNLAGWLPRECFFQNVKFFEKKLAQGSVFLFYNGH